MMRPALVSLGIALGVAVPVAFVAHPSFADATDAAVAEALVTSTLDNLGLTDLSDALTGALADDMTVALDAGVIDSDIRTAVEGVLENPEMLKGLAASFEAHRSEQVEAWASNGDATRPSDVPAAPQSTLGPLNGDKSGNSSGDDSSQDAPGNSENSNSGGSSGSSGGSSSEHSNNGGGAGSGGSGGSSGSGGSDNDDSGGGDVRDDHSGSTPDLPESPARPWAGALDVAHLPA